MKATVFLNGRFVGFHENGERLAKEIREKRRTGELPYSINVSFYSKTGEVFINSDKGRPVRPLIVVKNQKSTYTEAIEEKVKSGSTHWFELVKSGIIEYLDAEEEENAYVANSQKDITERTTHLEIDPLGILGYASAQVPFPEYNMAPRVLMAAQHTKQSLGLYASNFNLRTDTRAHILFYPQKPIVQTRAYSELGLSNRPSGENFVVAILSYKGFNMNDAVVMNKSSIERGMARSAFLRSYATEERRYPGGQKDKIEVPQEYAQGYMSEDAYSYLDEDGIINPETIVNGDAVLVGKTSPPRFLKEISALDVETEKRRESSLTVRSNESGIVDGVIISQTTSGNRLVKVRVRNTCIPEIGDKFASRFGQKGVISLLLNQADMPFTKDGITPDLILNPHAIPGRMTAGHLLEMLGGKAGSMDGSLKDGTAFSGQKQEEFEKILLSQGLRPTGQEYLYDGATGKRMLATIYMGVVYCQRLHHLVSLKMHARSRGPVQMLTHQPTEGRAREGGLRLGEMERDCFIGYGSALLLHERMIDSSDKTTELICQNCGALGVFDKIKKTKYCPLCESADVEDVEMSYAFKLLLDEMKSLHIWPKMKLKERG